MNRVNVVNKNNRQKINKYLIFRKTLQILNRFYNLQDKFEYFSRILLIVPRNSIECFFINWRSFEIDQLIMIYLLVLLYFRLFLFLDTYSSSFLPVNGEVLSLDWDPYKLFHFYCFSELCWIFPFISTTFLCQCFKISLSIFTVFSVFLFYGSHFFCISFLFTNQTVYF